MEQNVPCCVRKAWASVDDWLTPVMVPWYLEEEGMSWSLPLYPKLGHLTWEDQEFRSSPCRLLFRDCPQHRPRAESTSRREEWRPDPDSTPGTEESETPPAVEAAAQTRAEGPDLLAGVEAAAREWRLLTEKPDSPPGVEASAQFPVKEPDSPPGVEADEQTPAEETDSPPGVEADEQTPAEETDSSPGVEAAAHTMPDLCPEDSLRLSPGSWDRQLQPENSEEPTLPPDILELLAADLPDSGRQDQGLPPLPLSPVGSETSSEASLG